MAGNENKSETGIETENVQSIVNVKSPGRKNPGNLNPGILFGMPEDFANGPLPEIFGPATRKNRMAVERELPHEIGRSDRDGLA